jgi:hypothetical protein
MTYVKPQIQKLDSAIAAVRGGEKDDATPHDGNQCPFCHSVGAYEADE